ncbi:MAG: response regulator [Methanolinea sp.]|nr:response regulator [Methanolinea sp.]
MIRVLLVDDDPALFNVTKLALERDGGVKVDLCGSVREARARLKEHSYHVIISDYDMPLENGISFVRGLRESGVSTPFILFTGKGNEQVAMDACNAGIDYYLTKSGSPQEVFGRMRDYVVSAAQKSPSHWMGDAASLGPAQILECLPEPVLVLDAGLHICYLNRSAARVFATPEYATGPHTFTRFLTRESSMDLLASLERAINRCEDEEESRISATLDVSIPDNHHLIVDCTFLPLRAEKGKHSGFLVTCRECRMPDHLPTD